MTGSSSLDQSVLVGICRDTQFPGDLTPNLPEILLRLRITIHLLAKNRDGSPRATMWLYERAKKP